MNDDTNELPTRDAPKSLNVLVLGASGGTGRAAVQRLLAEGHHVTAFCRRPAQGAQVSARLRHFVGDATNYADVERAVAGHDAVVVALGITENPLRVRLLGSSGTPLNVRSVGTRHVIAAMRKHGVRRLVVQTTYGVGDTRDQLGLPERLFFSLILAPQIADTEIQHEEVMQSGLDWVLAQPVHLTDAVEDAAPFVSTEGETGGMAVSRAGVARVLAAAVAEPRYVRRCVLISGAAA